MIPLMKELDLFRPVHPKRRERVFLTGADRSYRIALTLYLRAEISGSVFFVCQNDYDAKKYYREFLKYASEEQVLYYPKEQLYFTFADSFSREIATHRLNVMRAAIDGKKQIIVTSIWALAERRLFAGAAHKKTFHAGDTLEMETLVRLLVNYGYVREERTEAPGQFTVRGGIIDYYDATQKHPVRVEFYGDEIDSVRTFDPDSQLSLEKAESFTVFPFDDQILSESEILAAIGRMRKEAEQSIPKVKDETLREEMSRNSTELFAKMEDSPYEAAHLVYMYAEKELSGILDLFEKKTVVLEEPSHLKKSYDFVKRSVAHDFVSFNESGLAFPGQMKIFADYEQIMRETEQGSVYALASVESAAPFLTVERKANAACADVIDFKGNIQIFIKQLAHYLQSDYKIVLTYENETQKQSLLSLMESYRLSTSEQIGVGIITLRKSPPFAGMDFALDKVLLVPYAAVAAKETKHRTAKKTKSERSTFFADIKPGDYVVHETHGIGRYDGIRQMRVAGIAKDYIKITYAREDVLYVPADQMDLVQKYIGTSDTPPRLNRLGSADWSNTKAKASGAVKELAQEYLSMYAERKNRTGYAFGPDTAWQKEFEDKFEFEPTEDQIRCTAEIKADMERPVPMDRLLCGDVGYGKTEVAQRAAFKAVMEGKQVAVLVPTTILALQHYNNFLHRFAGYPITIEMMSRLRSSTENKRTAEHAKTGRADIVIGTHRMLSKDVGFKDLGLLIVDEEQRFGVAHKDKLKLLKSTVDTLTLSATPIPRTLHMSLTGIRDLSVIETPPLTRVQIQTYVMEYEDIVIREAIQNELARDGQIFYVYNRVSNMPERTAQLSEMLPDARIAYAHGQMRESELEKIVLAFLDRQYDVLVCSTIIENGIDIINANTMIIEDADRLGLSQLYQLRGRIGRGAVAAYAYMTYRKDKTLSEIASKRLQSIKEFTKFGSGFKIAMRDLQVRGAGNLLGANQHGHFHNVGYEMYCRLLAEAVAEEQGETVKHVRETEIDLAVNAFLPKEYIPSEQQRIELYKTIAAVETEEDRDRVTEELIDVYADPPQSVLNLLEIAVTKAYAQQAGIAKIRQTDRLVSVEYFSDSVLDFERLQSLGKTYRLKLRPNTSVPTLLLSLPKDAEPLPFVSDLIKNLISISLPMQYNDTM